MGPGDHARIARELPRGNWTAANHDKLSRFIARYAGSGALALFDADNTTWTGDLGDAALIHMVQNLRLSPRLSSALPVALDVPAAGFGLQAAGRIFPRARAAEAHDAMVAACRAHVPSASSARPFAAFTEALVLPGGPLFGDAAFATAYAMFAGTVIATYNILEATVGCVALDAAEARDESALFPPEARAFFGGAVRFASMLDTGPRQEELAAAGKLGAYSQIALWEALDQTPPELSSIALATWEATPPDTPFRVAFPVEDADAEAPRPLVFAVDRERFAPGGRPAEGVRVGATAMAVGTRRRGEIVDLFAALTRHDIVPVVVTASHVDLVRAVLDQAYGFAGNPVLGMQPEMVDGRYAARLRAPATYGSGKVDAACALTRERTGGGDASLGVPRGRVVFAAGDTTTDLEMLAFATTHRLFFDRGKRPLMDFADFLLATGAGDRTLVQPPF
jgi:hypothetical protein